MSILKNLLKTKIFWKEDSNLNGEYIYINEGVVFKLKMNDFPDEVMFTLSLAGESIDFDDLPKKWKIEGMGIQSIKTMFDLKSFIIFIVVTAVFGFAVSKVFGLSFLIGCTITGGAILVNGLIIALTENKNDEKDE